MCMNERDRGYSFFQMKFEQMTWKCVFERNQSSCISPFSWCLWFVGSVPCVFRSTILVSVLFMLLVQHDVPFANFWSDHYFWKASLSLVSGYVPPNLDILSYLLEFWGLQYSVHQVHTVPSFCSREIHSDFSSKKKSILKKIRKR